MKKLSWLFAKGPKTISELTPFSSQFPKILYVAVKLKHVNSKTVLGPFANNLLKHHRMKIMLGKTKYSSVLNYSRLGSCQNQISNLFFSYLNPTFL
jgi:hypothetical protein